MGKKHAKMGRPSRGRTELMQMRLSPEEKKAFTEAAEACGLSVADWARINLRAASMPDQGKFLPGINIHGKTGGS